MNNTTEEHTMNTTKVRKPRTAKQKVERFMADNNIDFIADRSVEGIDLDSWSPPGTVWAATGCHTLRIRFWTDVPAAWKAMWNDVQYGLEPCPNAGNCEGCGDEVTT
jgi:hypothetical protein